MQRKQIICHLPTPLRSTTGALLFLWMALALILVAVGVFSVRIANLFIQNQKHQEALESAVLKAATDLSSIVINDPHFGYISLSDSPATGRNTLAYDGEPLPVLSINTVIAASRLDYIMALEMGNNEMKELALEDIHYAREAAVRLTHTLNQALQTGRDSEPVYDIDGNEIHPYADALNLYENNLNSPTGENIELKLELGWLKDLETTVTPMAQTAKANYSSPNIQINGYYKAYTNLPVDKEQFALTSVGTQATLANPNEFVLCQIHSLDKDLKELSIFESGNKDKFNPEQYNKFIASTIKGKVEWPVSDLFPWDKSQSAMMSCSACARPYTSQSEPAPSILVIAFPDGRPAKINSISDIFANEGLKKCTMNVSTPNNGDFPTEETSSLLPPKDIAKQNSCAFVLTQAFYDWLRSNYTLPNVDSVLNAVNQPFPTSNRSDESIFVVEITAQGQVVISKLNQNPFEDVHVNEKQIYAISKNPASINGINWTVTCRDQVHSLGTLEGGKHAGQTMPGDPINWAELTTYVNKNFAEEVVHRQPEGISISGNKHSDGSIPLSGSQLICDEGKELPRNLRKSSYCGGLAVEFRISSPTDPNAD